MLAVVEEKLLVEDGVGERVLMWLSVVGDEERVRSRTSQVSFNGMRLLHRQKVQ